MSNTNHYWTDQEDLLAYKEKRGRFTRARAIKVKRELRKLAFS